MEILQLCCRTQEGYIAELILLVGGVEHFSIYWEYLIIPTDKWKKKMGLVETTNQLLFNKPMKTIVISCYIYHKP